MFFWRRRRHPIRDEDLSAYVDGQIGPAERARLEAHIEGCDPCREALAELRALQRSLRELPEERAPRSFALREADVRPETLPRPLSTLERAPALLGGLATVAFLAFGSLVAVDLTGQGAEEEGGMALMRFGEPASQEYEQSIDGEVPDAAGYGSSEDGEKIAGEEGDGTESDERENVAPPAVQVPTEECAVAVACARDGDMAAGDSETGNGDGAADEEAEDGPGLEPLDSQATPECAPSARCFSLYSYLLSPSPSPTTTPAPTPWPDIEPEEDGDSRVPLRAAEAATAALALLTTGSLAIVLRRRRS